MLVEKRVQLQRMKSIYGPVFKIGDRVRISELDPSEGQSIRVGDVGVIRSIERHGRGLQSNDFFTVALDGGIPDAFLCPHEVEHAGRRG